MYRTPDYNSSVVSRSEIPQNISEFFAYLDACDPITDTLCAGWIVNGTPLKSSSGLSPLKDNATDLREDPCDRFLIKADPSLIMPFTERDPWSHPCAEACNYTYEICESRFTIPSSNETTRPEFKYSLEKTVPWTVMDRPYMTPDGTTPATVSPSPQSAATILPQVHRSPVESLYCSILSFFGVSC